MCLLSELFLDCRRFGIEPDRDRRVGFTSAHFRLAHHAGSIGITATLPVQKDNPGDDQNDRANSGCGNRFAEKQRAAGER